jgi:hypothetical protein
MRVPGLKGSWTHKTRYYELRIVVGVILRGQALNEEKHFGTSVRERHSAHGKVSVRIDLNEIAAVYEVLDLSGFLREGEIFLDGDLMLLLHRRRRSAQRPRLGRKWNSGRKHKERDCDQ